MPRPPSYREQPRDRSCSNCRFCKLVAYKLDTLCFHGDSIEIHGHNEYPVTADWVFIDGNEVGMMDGDEYGRVWAGRVVDGDDICDEWQPEESKENN